MEKDDLKRTSDNEKQEVQEKTLTTANKNIKWYQARWFLAMRLLVVFTLAITGTLIIVQPDFISFGSDQELSLDTKEDLKNDLLFYSLVSGDSASNFKDSSALLKADRTLLEKGQDQKFKSDDLNNAIIETNDYMNSYKMVVMPGVYTIKYSSKTNDDAGIYFNMGTSDGYEYYFDNEPHGYYMNEFQNVTVNDLITLTALNNSQDQFKFKFEAQDEYIDFDQDNIKPGVYTGGVNLPIGEYKCSSKIEDDTYLYVRNSVYDEVINVQDVDSIDIGIGDVVIISDENTQLQKI